MSGRQTNMRLADVLRNAAGVALRRALGCLAPYSRLVTVSDSALWVISGEMREVAGVASGLGVRTLSPRLLPWLTRQAVFFGSHFDLMLSDRWFETGNRLATAYFHGKPGTGEEAFDRCHAQLRRCHNRISRIQVSCRAMESLILESGIDAAKVHRIPIGVNLSFFVPRTVVSRRSARRRLGIPEDALVVGSFQKDGEGWGEGMKPKRVKGPDVLVETLRLLHERQRNLHVLLSGPARGFVKGRLAELGIPYTHRYFRDYRDVCALYPALDAYLVASREEGGPKAVLEAMAGGVPLVSTRVGQAVDLVRHGENGWLAEVGDAPALAACAMEALTDRALCERVVACGARTASENTYEAQRPQWRAFFEGFVEGVR